MECYLKTCLQLNNETARSRLHNEVLQNLYSSPTNILQHRRTKGIDHTIIFLFVLWILDLLHFFWITYWVGGHENVVGIVTRYGLESPRIESRWGRIFWCPSRPALGLNQPPTQRVPGLSRGWIGRGVASTTQHHLAPRLRKEQSNVYMKHPCWYNNHNIYQDFQSQ